MVSKTWKGLLVATAASAMTMMAANVMAQAPQGGAPRGPGGGMGGGMGMGGGQLDRAGVIQRFGLGDEALKLTAAQKGELDKAADAYVAEMKTVNEKYPMTQGQPPGQDAMQARMKARDNLNAAVGKVLNAEQKKTWDARPQGGPGGMGGPGGGMGGRPPGGPGGPGGFGGPPPGGAK